MKHLDAGRTVEALAITSKLVLRDPDTIETLERHAIVLLAQAVKLEGNGDVEQSQRRREEALEAYLSACNLSGVTGGTQFSAAQLAHMLGKIKIAIPLYEKVHETLPNDGRSSLWLSQIYLLEENWESANRWIELSLKRQPSDPFTLISAGLIKANLNDCEAAKNYTLTAIKHRPRDEDIRLMQARVFRICDEPARALELLYSLSTTLRNSELVDQEISMCNKLIRKSQSEY
ncbi:MAG: hypothetical protein QF444_05860 [Phycisphaerales bacterium]|nr:hypothetical protein [Phycisphaerales bacterium]